jgi:hypothetical protein
MFSLFLINLAFVIYTVYFVGYLKDNWDKISYGFSLMSLCCLMFIIVGTIGVITEKQK